MRIEDAKAKEEEYRAKIDNFNRQKRHEDAVGWAKTKEARAAEEKKRI